MLGTTGAGASMLPTITQATRDLADDDIPSGTTMINVLNQLAVSVTTAAVAVVLEVSGSVQVAFALPVSMMAAALAVALVALRRPVTPG